MKISKHLSKSLKVVYVGYSKCRHYYLSIDGGKTFKRTTLKALNLTLLARISKQGFKELKAKLLDLYKAHSLIVKHNMDHKLMIKALKLQDRVKEALRLIKAHILGTSKTFKPVTPPTSPKTRAISASISKATPPLGATKRAMNAIEYGACEGAYRI